MDSHRDRCRWYCIGQAAFHGDPSEHLPPLDDHDAQTAWLRGFHTAWAYDPPPNTNADRLTQAAHADLEVALMRTLAHRGDLAARLFALPTAPTRLHRRH